MRIQYLIFTILFIFAFSSISAQTPEFGLRGGLILSSTGGADAGDSRIKPGFMAGVYVPLAITNMYTLEPGVYYSLKGSRIEDGIQSSTFHLHYLDVPVYARIFLTEGFNIFAGPQISYLIGSRSRFENNGQIFIDTSTEGLRKFDLGLGIGIGYNLPVPVNLNINLGYDWGLLSLDSEGNTNTYNRLLRLAVGYTF
ncbi:porin family protein [soil metagenome]